jgi:outer membrane protein assembly factor BamB
LQTGVADSTLPRDLGVRWSFKAQAVIEASPVIFEQTALVGATDGKLYAIDLPSGKKKWEYRTGGIMAAPAARNGAVYVGDVEGQFHCVDFATGTRRWVMATQGSIHSAANFAGNNIVFGCHDHHLYCVTPEGKLAWQVKTKEKVLGTPAATENHVLVGGCDQGLHVVEFSKGREVMTLPLEGHIGASVAVRGDQLYVGTMANRFLAVDWKKGVILWQFEAKRGGQPFFSSAAVTEDLVIAGSRDKYVRAWQRQTGKEVWAFATKGRVDASPIVAGQSVVVLSMDRNMYVLDLARGTEMTRLSLGLIPGSPAVGSGCVVVATIQGEVLCLSKKK